APLPQNAAIYPDPVQPLGPSGYSPLSGGVTPSTAGVNSNALSAFGQAPAQNAAQAFQDQANQSAAARAADVQAASEPKLDSTGAPNFWKTLLAGALTSLQGTPQGGRPSFLGGVGSGARAQADAAQQAKQNALRQQQADQQNERENMSAEDQHQAHLANGMLTQMKIEQVHDQLSKTSQDNIRASM